MTDFEEKLNAILSSPDTMAQVMSIAQSLGGTPSPEPPSHHEAEEKTTPPLSSFDPAAIQAFLPLLQGGTKAAPSSHRQLLDALTPFLREERREKLQKALRTARLLSAGKQLLTEMGERDV